jgi:hypothetical protein
VEESAGVDTTLLLVHLPTLPMRVLGSCCMTPPSAECCLVLLCVGPRWYCTGASMGTVLPAFTAGCCLLLLLFVSTPGYCTGPGSRRVLLS